MEGFRITIRDKGGEMKYTVEEVRAMASDLRGAPGTSMIGTHISLPTARAVAIYEALCAYAERIKADEGAVPVAWRDGTSLYHSARERIYGLVDNDCGSKEILWSGSSLVDAAAEWVKQADAGNKTIHLTGLNCGVLADYQMMQYRYGTPKGTFACPLCSKDAPHTHDAEFVADMQEVLAAGNAYQDKRWAEADAIIVWLENKYPPRTPLFTHPPAQAAQAFALPKSFVDRATSSDESEPQVMGAGHLVQFTTAQVDWLMTFNARLIVNGLHPEDARMWMRATDQWDFDADPVAEADSTWQDFFANPDDDGPFDPTPTAEPVAQGEVDELFNTFRLAYYGSNKSLAPELESFRRAYRAIAAQPAQSVDVEKSFAGFRIVENADVPDGEVWVYDKSKLVGRITAALQEKGNG